MKQEKKLKLLTKYFTLVLSSILLALSYNLLIVPNEIVTGGVSGIAVILKNIINPSLLILSINIVLIILSFLILGKNKTKDFIIGALLFPLFVELTKNIGVLIHLDDLDLLLSVIFAAVISGFSIGIIAKNGFSTGGTDIAAKIISKLTKRSIGKSLFIIDGLIILSGVFTYGIIKLLYAIIFIYIFTLVVDKVMLGISNNKAFYIVTNKENEVKDYIIQGLNRGATILQAMGGFNNQNKNIIFCVVPSRDYFRLKEGIIEIDADAFFIVTDAYEVMGGA